MTYETEIASVDARYLRGDLSATEYDRIYGNINERYGRGTMTYATEREAKTALDQKPNTHNWYMYQHCDGRWAIALKTNRKA